MTSELCVTEPQLNVDYGNVPRQRTRYTQRQIDRCIYRSSNGNPQCKSSECRYYRGSYQADGLSSMEEQVFRSTPASYHSLYNRAIVELMTTLEYVDERKRIDAAGEQDCIRAVIPKDSTESTESTDSTD